MGGDFLRFGVQSAPALLPPWLPLAVDNNRENEKQTVTIFLQKIYYERICV
jgi:hypothetical protein